MVVQQPPPYPYPYSQRRLSDLKLPFLELSDLDALLRPRTGERMLELGPGTGLQALHVAPQLGPDGRLDIVDVQAGDARPRDAPGEGGSASG